MELNGLQIQKLLPKTNCKECGSNTCLAFAMNLVDKKASLDQCPYASDEAQQAFKSGIEPSETNIHIKKKFGFGKLWLLSLPVILILGIIYSYSENYSYMDFGEHFYMVFLIFIIYIIISFIIWYFYFKLKSSDYREKNKEILQDYENKKQVEYNNLANKYSNLKSLNVPNYAKTISIIKDKIDLKIYNGDFSIWKDNDSLHLFPTLPKYKDTDYSRYMNENYYKIISLKLSKIEYFYTQGEVFRETKISGGGGGGSSIGGAVVGGMLAGGVGAVIGSRKKINEIKSEMVTHDTRETYINYFNLKNNRESIFLDFKNYQTLNDIIPEKKFNIVSAIQNSQTFKSVQNIGHSKTITTQIRELAQLKEEGIISEDEFKLKKEELLSRI